MKAINAIIWGVLVLCVTLYIFGYGIRYNHSESLPQRLYLSSPFTDLKIGQIVTFNMPASKVTFAKLIAGLPGDIIEVRDKKIYVNNQEKGSIIESFTPINNLVVPEGFFFALGMHPHSFDSRYAEFGLVPTHSIKEQLWPIF